MFMLWTALSFLVAHRISQYPLFHFIRLFLQRSSFNTFQRFNKIQKDSIDMISIGNLFAGQFLIRGMEAEVRSIMNSGYLLRSRDVIVHRLVILCCTFRGISVILHINTKVR